MYPIRYRNSSSTSTYTSLTERIHLLDYHYKKLKVKWKRKTVAISWDKYYPPILFKKHCYDNTSPDKEHPVRFKLSTKTCNMFNWHMKNIYEITMDKWHPCFWMTSYTLLENEKKGQKLVGVQWQTIKPLLYLVWEQKENPKKREEKSHLC